jgi:hypothetical protein
MLFLFWLFSNTLGSKRNAFDGFTQVHDYYDEFLNTRENRDEQSYFFRGVKIVSEIGMSTVMFGGGRERYVTIPEHPAFFQKLLAFLLVQTRYARFAAIENQYGNYAYPWLGARRIFGW